MYLLYVDASGTPEVSDPNCSTYVLLGLCVHESVWNDLESAVASVRSRYEFPGVPMELHAKDFCVQSREQEKITDFEGLDRRSRHAEVKKILEARIATAAAGAERDRRREKLRQFLPFCHLSRAERSQLLVDVLDLVGTMDGVRLFAEAVDKKENLRQTGRTDAVRDAFAQVVSRFDAFLSRQALNRPRERGMLIFDDERTYRDILHREFTTYRTAGHPWGRVENVIEQPFFVDSASVSAVQLADVCAYAVRRHIERAALANEHEIINFRRIFHRFDRSGPKLHGIRHYCQPRTCSCMVCVERGHS